MVSLSHPLLFGFVINEDKQDKLEVFQHMTWADIQSN